MMENNAATNPETRYSERQKGHIELQHALSHGR